MREVEHTNKRGDTATRSGNERVAGAASEAFTRWFHHRHAPIELPSVHDRQPCSFSSLTSWYCVFRGHSELKPLECT